MQAYLSLLRQNPGFSKLWLAQVISLLGDWFNTIVLSVLVVQYSPPDRAGLAVSGLLLARFIPPMLLTPLAGVLVDRFDRKLLLILSNVLRAAVVLLLIFTARGPECLPAIYVLTVVQWMLSSVFEPGQSAMIPGLVPRTDLVLANTLVSVTWSVMLALGAVVGGIVATLFGSGVALMLDALTFIIAAWLIYDIRSYQPKPNKDTTGDSPVTFVDGLRFVRANPDIAATALVKGGSSITNMDTVMTIYATTLFAIGTDGQVSLGLMYSAFGVGALVGPLLTNRISDGSVRDLMRLIAVGFVLSVLGWLLLGSVGTLLMVCVAIFIRAMGGSVNWTYSAVILQKRVPDDYLGRVFALDMTAFYIAMVTGTIAMGWAIDAVDSVRVIVHYATAVTLIPLCLWLLFLRRLGAPDAVVAPGD